MVFAPRIKIPVIPTPLYCPPKNSAVNSKRDSQNSTPSTAHIIIFRLFTIAHVVFVPIMEADSRINRITYPTCSHSILSAFTSFARNADMSNVKLRLMHVPTTMPAGIDIAFPVTLWLLVISPIPFPFILFKIGIKIPGQAVPIPV